MNIVGILYMNIIDMLYMVIIDMGIINYCILVY
jgi:hypothetical protein